MKHQEEMIFSSNIDLNHTYMNHLKESLKLLKGSASTQTLDEWISPRTLVTMRER